MIIEGRSFATYPCGRAGRAMLNRRLLKTNFLYQRRNTGGVDSRRFRRIKIRTKLEGAGGIKHREIKPCSNTLKLGSNWRADDRTLQGRNSALPGAAWDRRGSRKKVRERFSQSTGDRNGQAQSEERTGLGPSQLPSRTPLDNIQDHSSVALESIGGFRTPKYRSLRFTTRPCGKDENDE